MWMKSRGSSASMVVETGSTESGGDRGVGYGNQWPSEGIGQVGEREWWWSKDQSRQKLRVEVRSAVGECGDYGESN
ncbi:hypothetical protein HPP92_025728 [Vanilla planifolia]|uniref:Uncharacterized protein n=1 Tax=Vanilla planifolia TaxID=51239 RepID=A0A835PMI9_VANPL|nr:hypothetical protein HPP92_025728 [Vanilla planifolia]